MTAPDTAAAPRAAAVVLIDLDRAWRLNPQVSVRPEPFGALLYHFGNRKLSFLKDRDLLAVVQALADHPTARAAIESVGAKADAVRALRRALTSLAASDILIRPPGEETTP